MTQTTPNLGLTQANSTADPFDWTIYLRDNLTIIDNQFSTKTVSTVPVRFVESVSTVPATNLTDGRLVWLNAADSGFPAETLLVYASTFWKAVSPEILSAVPTQSLASGRRVLLSSANGPFQQWDMIVNTDGANTWKRIDNDTLLSIATFRALAGFPDGFRALVQVDATNGINWNLRNNSNSGSAYKFEVQGIGPSLFSEIDTSQTTNTTGSWVDLATVGPSITVPLTGEYEIRAAATFTAPGGGAATGQMAVNDGTGTILTPSSIEYIGTASKSARQNLIIPRIALTRGNVVKVQYQTDTTAFAWQQRTLQLIPLRFNQT